MDTGTHQNISKMETRIMMGITRRQRNGHQNLLKATMKRLSNNNTEKSRETRGIILMNLSWHINDYPTEVIKISTGAPGINFQELQIPIKMSSQATERSVSVVVPAWSHQHSYNQMNKHSRCHLAKDWYGVLNPLIILSSNTANFWLLGRGAYDNFIGADRLGRPRLIDLIMDGLILWWNITCRDVDTVDLIKYPIRSTYSTREQSYSNEAMYYLGSLRSYLLGWQRSWESYPCQAIPGFDDTRPLGPRNHRID